MTTVTYQDQDDKEQGCTTKAEVEQACKDEGHSRYTQVYLTPFTSGSIFEDIGYLAATDAVEHILQGTYQCAKDVDICISKNL